MDIFLSSRLRGKRRGWWTRSSAKGIRGLSHLPVPARRPALTPEEEKAEALWRMKCFATGLLLASIAVFIAARLLLSVHPVFGFVAAFAEAAIVGAMADWYAVTALFRHPLGIRVPHTAIIPENQDKIGDNIGRFIEKNFLAAAPISEKLRQVDFATLAADWLADRQRSARLAHFVVQFLPQGIEALERAGLRSFLVSSAVKRLDTLEVGPLAAQMLETFTADGRHHALLDDLLGSLHRVLGDARTVEAIQQNIREGLPTVFKYLKADDYLMRKIIGAAHKILEDVKDDPEHGIRKEFDAYIASFIEKLKTEPGYLEATNRIKASLLARPEVRDLAQNTWEGLKAWVATNAAKEGSVLHSHAEAILATIGQKLKNDEAIRGQINAGMVTTLQKLVQTRKHSIAEFAADQVKAWDKSQLTRLLELNIGRDLQYIRINGTLVGGLIGLLIYSSVVVFGL
jgi:uncharacterized membrane-anchored protein YjiN (DUF445 family)